jgi:hypothetical protein
LRAKATVSFDARDGTAYCVPVVLGFQLRDLLAWVPEYLWLLMHEKHFEEAIPRFTVTRPVMTAKRFASLGPRDRGFVVYMMGSRNDERGARTLRSWTARSEPRVIVHPCQAT